MQRALLHRSVKLCTAVDYDPKSDLEVEPPPKIPTSAMEANFCTCENFPSIFWLFYIFSSIYRIAGNFRGAHISRISRMGSNSRTLKSPKLILS